MLSTSDAVNKFTFQGEGPVLGPAFTVGNFSNMVNTEVINNGEYAVTGYNVYAIRNTTPQGDVANASRTGLDAAGNFTITCSRTAEISFLIIGSGAGGTSSNQGTGGPSSGQARYIKISLNPGTYSCNYNVGVHGCGGSWGGYTKYVCSWWKKQFFNNKWHWDLYCIWWGMFRSNYLPS